MTTVLMGGRKFELDDLQTRPAFHSRWFEKARAEAGHAECLCSVPRRLRLVIRQREGLYHLAGWPLEGEQHQSFCFFSKLLPSSSGRGSYAAGAIVDREDGSADIKVDVPLRIRAGDRAPSAPRGVATAGAGERRRSVGMLGLLHELWEGASLTRWGKGWSRNWSRCHWHLRQLDRRINGTPLSECLHVVRPWDPARKEEIEAEFARFKGRLGESGSFRYRGYVMGELKTWRPTEYGYRIEIRHQRDAYFASKALIEAVEKSSRAVMAARENQDARTVVLMLVDVTPKGYLQVVDMTLMLTTKHYLPAESSFELQMADALVEAGRSFVKPLRYDGIEDTFPDFKLLDTSPATVVEVWGMMGNASYEARKTEKEATYRANRVPVIAWDTRRPLPDLRPARSAETTGR
ncbi:DUF1173 family protein [Burkholderia sp. Ac-20365]|uniref:DUF1173 family protein n=1 Tax=Burkholderia sp. Ac-20365 TaxID=2703897 RepID=UPI00197B5B41|nr:DUF1173 family protein [Burkholderia sp. Ac-20365]MBN3761088.1 DUF1173 domain-containing protein [Burkholderia sp. Ac-20365]